MDVVYSFQEFHGGSEQQLQLFLHVQALTEYWNNLPEEHKDTLFSMREEDFVAELDAHMKYQLKVRPSSFHTLQLQVLHG